MPMPFARIAQAVLQLAILQLASLLRHDVHPQISLCVMQEELNAELADSKTANAAAVEAEAVPVSGMQPTPVTPPQQQPAKPAPAHPPVPTSLPVPLSGPARPSAVPAALSFASFFPGARPAAAKPPTPPTPAQPSAAAAAAAAAAVKRVRPPAYNPFAPAPRPKPPVPSSPALGPLPAAQAKPAAAPAAGVMQAASPGNKCPVCKLQQSDYISLTCKHWGPCVGCLPDTSRIQEFYRTCMTCQQPTQHLQRVFLNH